MDYGYCRKVGFPKNGVLSQSLPPYPRFAENVYQLFVGQNHGLSVE